MQRHVVKVKTNYVPQSAFKLFVNTVKKNRKPAGFSPKSLHSIAMLRKAKDTGKNVKKLNAFF